PRPAPRHRRRIRQDLVRDQRRAGRLLMPLKEGPVGPFPEGADPEEYDRRRRRVLWTMPSGLYILGSRAGDRRNGMTCNWATQVGFDPKLLAVSVEHGAVTHELISEGRMFCLNLVDREDRAIVR